MNDRFSPSLLDRFLEAGVRPAAGHQLRTFSLNEMKRCVARDLEALLNTRLADDESAFDGFPLATSSILRFGISDFSSRSLANPDDRDAICRSIEAAVGAHEPRLKDVAVSLSAEAPSLNRLNFVIKAILTLRQGREHVSFDALLQPTTLQYSISPGRLAGPSRAG